MGVNLSTPVAGTSGCFRDQLQYHNEHDWRLPSFNFPLPITVFSVEAGKEFECTFMIDGERVADPYLKFHPKLFGIGPGSQLQARLISPQVVDYEVGHHKHELSHPEEIDTMILQEDWDSWEGGKLGRNSYMAMRSIFQTLYERQLNLAAVTVQKHFRAWQARKKYRWDVRNGLGEWLELREYKKVAAAELA